LPAPAQLKMSRFGCRPAFGQRRMPHFCRPAGRRPGRAELDVAIAGAKRVGHDLTRLLQRRDHGQLEPRYVLTERLAGCWRTPALSADRVRAHSCISVWWSLDDPTPLTPGWSSTARRPRSGWRLHWPLRSVGPGPLGRSIHTTRWVHPVPIDDSHTLVECAAIPWGPPSNGVVPAGATTVIVGKTPPGLGQACPALAKLGQRAPHGRQRPPRDPGHRDEHGSWTAATRNAVETAARTVQDRRVAEVDKLDMIIENGTVTTYLARMNVSFKYEQKQLQRGPSRGRVQLMTIVNRSRISAPRTDAVEVGR
jgi:flavin-binding protein dodecin